MMMRARHLYVARPHVVDGQVAANVLSKQSRTADKGWF